MSPARCSTRAAPPNPSLRRRSCKASSEESNVDPVSEIARMIEVQRAYELGQTFLDREDERVRAAIRTLSGGT